MREPFLITVDGYKKMIDGIATIEINREVTQGEIINLDFEKLELKITNSDPVAIYTGVMRFETGEEITIIKAEHEILEWARNTRITMALWDEYPDNMCRIHIFKSFFKTPSVMYLIMKCNGQLGS